MPVNDAKLNPCPVCKTSDRLEVVEDFLACEAWIKCRACGHGTEFYRSVEDAIAAWNDQGGKQ